MIDIFIPSDQFQTIPVVAEFMASLIPSSAIVVLEPTPGIGNLVSALKKRGSVHAPNRFEDIIPGYRVDAACMNPPFTPMKEGFRYLSEVMEMTDYIVALLPWFILINSDRRMSAIKQYGLRRVISLPRKAFAGSRIQCCILVMEKGYAGDTTLDSFNWDTPPHLHHPPPPTYPSQ